MEKKFAQRALKKLGFELITVNPTTNGFDAEARQIDGPVVIYGIGKIKNDAYDDAVRQAELFVKQQQKAAPKAPRVKRQPKPIHATREAWLQAFIEAARPKFKAIGSELPKQVRVSIGFSSKGARSNRAGECWSSKSSSDGMHEIFIIPALQSQPSIIADILTHELIHACGIMDHGKGFRKVALALGLEGKMTATVAGAGWHEWADPIVKALGTFPGAELKGSLIGGKKKQTTRMRKLTCNECEWTCRTSSVHIQGHALRCAVEDCSGQLELA